MHVKTGLTSLFEASRFFWPSLPYHIHHVKSGDFRPRLFATINQNFKRQLRRWITRSRSNHKQNVAQKLATVNPAELVPLEVSQSLLLGTCCTKQLLHICALALWLMLRFRCCISAIWIISLIRLSVKLVAIDANNGSDVINLGPTPHQLFR